MKSPPPALQTDRLLLSPLQLEDAGPIQRIFPRWEIVRYLDTAVPWPYPEDGALSFVRDVALPAMTKGEQWSWAIRPKSRPAEMIGVITLSKAEDNNRGFWLDPAWQGQGLMTEACQVVNNYWFDTLNFPLLRVSKATANGGSRRLSEKEGMRLVRNIERDFVSGWQAAGIWEITADEWRSKQRHRG